MNWSNNPMTGFALATTAASPKEARIVAMVKRTINDNINAPAIPLLVNTPATIPAASTKVHGITAEKAATGHAALAALAILTANLEDAAKSNTPVVIFNADWFFEVIAAEAEAELVKFQIPENLIIIDPMVIDNHINRETRAGNRTLPAAVRRWGLQDVRYGKPDQNLDAALRLAWRMGSTHPELAKMTPQELHQAQGQWRKNFLEGREVHLASRGKTAA